MEFSKEEVMRYLVITKNQYIGNLKLSPEKRFKETIIFLRDFLNDLEKNDSEEKFKEYFIPIHKYISQFEKAQYELKYDKNKTEEYLKEIENLINILILKLQKEIIKF